MNDYIVSKLIEAKDLLDNFINSDQIIKIEKAADLMSSSILSGNKIIACGNGGSMSDAMHFAEELSGNFKHQRKALPAFAISDPAYITCVANDFGFDKIFSRYIEAFGKKNDILFAISTSGNSPNILQAAKSAQKKQMKIIALTGKNGGELKNFADIEIRVEHYKFSDRIQEIHIKIIHILIDLIEQKLFHK